MKVVPECGHGHAYAGGETVKNGEVVDQEDDPVVHECPECGEWVKLLTVPKYASITG